MTPNNVLSLHFNGPVHPNFIPELSQVSPHPFKSEEKGVDPRNVLTKPGYAEVERVVVLTFEDGDRRMDFMMKPECRQVYDKYNKMKPVAEKV